VRLGTMTGGGLRARFCGGCGTGFVVGAHFRYRGQVRTALILSSFRAAGIPAREEACLRA
jgi:hypothetical protein